MNTRLPQQSRAQGRRSGFSLVEVTIAIGIVSFALVTLLGVVPVGLIATQDAMRQTARSQIIKQISSDLGMMRFDKLGNYLGSTQYYDYNGCRSVGTNDRIFVATMTNELPSYPGSSILSGLDERFKRVVVTIRRAEGSTNVESRTALAVFNASGKPKP
jgi:uncharacterized protein (TIGR02598 family)